MKKIVKLSVTLASAAVLALVPLSAGAASKQSYVIGGNTISFEPYTSLMVGDGAHDGHWIQGQYVVSGSSVARVLNNRSGGGTSVSGQAGGTIVTLRACISAGLTMNCDGWR